MPFEVPEWKLDSKVFSLTTHVCMFILICVISNRKSIFKRSKQNNKFTYVSNEDDLQRNTTLNLKVEPKCQSQDSLLLGKLYKNNQMKY